ncbi:ATP-binding cassette domain-containing protein [Candidatus Latescibacterota bacterium]
MNDEKIAVETKNLTVTFSRWGQTVTALDHVNLSIPTGQWVMLVGHNGSGKSTLLKAISNRLNIDTGIIKIDGKQLHKLRVALIAEKVFHVHQDPLLGTAPKLTLFENLMVADYQAQQEGTPRKLLYDKYSDLLQPLGLKDRMKQLARYFSGGERQLIALLIARLRPSSLMLLDEPLAALDPAKADICLELIRSLHQDGRSIIQVTHDPTLALSKGNRTVVLQNGKIVYDKLDTNRQMKEIQEVWI